jgi:hypothetical protein
VEIDQVRMILSYGIRLVLSSAILLFAACASPGGGAPPVDLSAPGWTVRQGQALWQPDHDKPEIAGDVVLSTHPSGGSYIQFSKTLPILSARIQPGGRWEFENTSENKRYSGGGTPPKRIVWLQFLRVLEGQEISGRWTVARPSPDFVSLENEFSGERLQVRFQN